MTRLLDIDQTPVYLTCAIWRKVLFFFWYGQSLKIGTGVDIKVSSLGCYDKIRSGGGLNNRRIFLIVLEAGTSKIKVLAYSVPG